MSDKSDKTCQDTRYLGYMSVCISPSAPRNSVHRWCILAFHPSTENMQCNSVETQTVSQQTKARRVKLKRPPATSSSNFLSHIARRNGEHGGQKGKATMVTQLAWHDRAWQDYHGEHGRRGVDVRTKSRWGMVRENPRIIRKRPFRQQWYVGSLARLGIFGVLAPYAA